MNRSFLTAILFINLTLPNKLIADVMEISANDGDLYEIINADTLTDGTQAHEYHLVSTNQTYKMTGTITAKGDLVIRGVLNSSTGRPPTIQSEVLADGTTVGTLFVLTGDDSEGHFENIYLLAKATNGESTYGTAIEVKGDNFDLYVKPFHDNHYTNLNS